MGSSGSKVSSDEAEAKAQARAAEAREKAQKDFFEKMQKMQDDRARSEREAAQIAAEAQQKMHERIQEMQGEHSRTIISMMEKNQQAEREREARFVEFMAKNSEKEQELLKANDELQKKLDAAETAFLEDATDPEKYEEKQVEIFQEFCDKVADLPDPVKTAKPSVAVLGHSGVGKSSLINSLAGQEVTPVGIVDTTKVVCKCYEGPDMEYWDVPGCSEERSYTNLRSIMAIKEMHFVLITYIDRAEHIVKLERLVAACNVPYLVVRNKIDSVTDEEAKKQGFESRSAYLRHAHEDESRKIKGRLIYVSAKSKEGLEILQEVLSSVTLNQI